MSISGLIDNVIDDLALSRTNRFYPTYIEKCTEIPFEDVFNYLVDLVKLNKLNLKWEVICNNSGCCNKIGCYDTYEEIIGQQIFCEFCGEEIEVTEYNIFPIFEFVEDYKRERQNYIRGLKKKHLNAICIPRIITI